MLSDRRQVYRLVIPDYQPQTWLNYTICWRYDIAEILPKLGLNINQSIKSCLWLVIRYHETVHLPAITQHCPETMFNLFLVIWSSYGYPMRRSWVYLQAMGWFLDYIVIKIYVYIKQLGYMYKQKKHYKDKAIYYYLERMLSNYIFVYK
jgi:hypothetical protein